jgi:hypothetical protein
MAALAWQAIEEPVSLFCNSFWLAVGQERPLWVSCVDCSLPNLKDALFRHAETLDTATGRAQLKFKVSSRKVI